MQPELKSSLFRWSILLGGNALVGIFAPLAIATRTTPGNTTEVFHTLDNTENRAIEPQTTQKSAAAKATKPFTTLVAANNETLFLFGTVESPNSSALVSDIHRMNEESSKAPILLVIDSPGGSVMDGAKVISAIESSRRPVLTVCYGLCASMAAMIHQYGTKRLMVDRSILMFHNASGSVEGEVTKMISHLTFVNDYVNKMDRYVAHRANMNFSDFSKLQASEIWIDAEDSYGLYSDQTISLNLTQLKKEKTAPFSEYLKQSHKQLSNENFKNVVY
jgi:ATP-dependent Clp protease protease subunit